MLYDPRWNPNVPSVQGFMDWLETKNPDERYDWGDTEQCACAQYAKSIACYSDWNGVWRRGRHSEIWLDLNVMARGPRKFGTLLKRMKRLQARETANA